MSSLVANSVIDEYHRDILCDQLRIDTEEVIMRFSHRFKIAEHIICIENGLSSKI